MTHESIKARVATGHSSLDSYVKNIKKYPCCILATGSKAFLYPIHKISSYIDLVKSQYVYRSFMYAHIIKGVA